MIDLHLKI